MRLTSGPTTAPILDRARPRAGAEFAGPATLDAARCDDAGAARLERPGGGVGRPDSAREPLTRREHPDGGFPASEAYRMGQPISQNQTVSGLICGGSSRQRLEVVHHRSFSSNFNRLQKCLKASPSSQKIRRIQLRCFLLVICLKFSKSPLNGRLPAPASAPFKAKKYVRTSI